MAIIELLKGLLVTLRYVLRKPVTEQYPEQRPPLRPRFRGRHVLGRHENGLEKCVGCALCATACPSKCIYVEAAENTEEERHSPGERYARMYEINLTRCIFCGFCEEACPTGAITLQHIFELSDYSRDVLLYEKQRMLVAKG